MSNARRFAISLLVAVFFQLNVWDGIVIAQVAIPTTNALSAPPAISPATRRARHVVVIPPGFHTVKNGPRIVICEPNEDAWVTETLNDTAPTTQPTTMPEDLLARLKEKRDLFKGRLAADLTINDAQIIDKFYDTTLLPQVQKVASIDPPIFYLVCSRDKLKQILRDGWQDPRFYYNRAADDVTFDTELKLADDGLNDDLIMPAIYFETTTPQQRRDMMKLVVSRNERMVMDAVSRRGQVVVQLAVIDFIQSQAFVPLKLHDDQQWLAMGLEAILSSRYMADLAGVNADELVARILRDNPNNPMRADAIDLLHPPDRNTLRPEWVSAYGDAFRVKSARAVSAWIAKAGDGAASLTLVAIHASPPADGAALVKLIQTVTGVDLTAEVTPK